MQERDDVDVRPRPLVLTVTKNQEKNVSYDHLKDGSIKFELFCHPLLLNSLQNTKQHLS